MDEIPIIRICSRLKSDDFTTKILNNKYKNGYLFQTNIRNINYLLNKNYIYIEFYKNRLRYKYNIETNILSYIYYMDEFYIIKLTKELNFFAKMNFNEFMKRKNYFIDEKNNYRLSKLYDKNYNLDNINFGEINVSYKNNLIYFLKNVIFDINNKKKLYINNFKLY